METIFNVFIASWEVVLGYTLVCAIFIAFAVIALKLSKREMRQVSKLMFGVTFAFCSLSVNEIYDVLKDHPEDIAIFTDDKLRSSLYYEYVEDCRIDGEHNFWDINIAHKYYQRHLARQRKEQWFAKHEVVSVCDTGVVFRNIETGNLGVMKRALPVLTDWTQSESNF